MKIFFLSLPVAFFLFYPAHGSNDSLSIFSFQDLFFHSSFEKDAFECLTDGKPCHYMKNAFATDSDFTEKDYLHFKTRFYNFLDKLKEDRRFQRNPARQIKYLFTAIHNEYFRLYRSAPLFSNIFINGEFNCATASVLFALAFDYYSIPYEIILQTDHVYLLAYPGQQSIIVETTNPLRGTVQSFDQRARTRAVQSLVEMKIVTQEEVNSKGVDLIFREVYLSEKHLSLHQLISTLYYNEGLKQSENLNYVVAYELLKKASFLYPTRITTGLLILTASIVFDRVDYRDIYTYRLMGDFEKFIPFGVPQDAIIQQGVFYLSKALGDGENSLMDSIHLWINQFLTKNEILQELNFSYHYNRSLSLINDFKLDEALETMEIAYGLKPRDHNLNLLFMETLGRKLSSERNNQSSYEYLKVLALRMPEVTRNKQFQVFNQVAMLNLMNQYYIQNNFEQAESIRSEFELRFTPNEVESPEIIRYLEEVYSRASLIYFRINRISRARRILESGLKYAPESHELKSKLYSLH